MFIRIIATPPGEAPAEVRREWVGMALPLVAGEKGPRTLHGYGILTGPRTFLGALMALLRGRWQTFRGYLVDAPQALLLLAEKAPGAAQWWRECAPQFWQPGRTFLFPAQVCEAVAAGPIDLASAPVPVVSEQFFAARATDVTRNPTLKVSLGQRPPSPPEQPPGSQVLLEQNADGVTLRVPPLGVWNTRGLFLFGLLWSGFVFCFSGVVCGAGRFDFHPFQLMLLLFAVFGTTLILHGFSVGHREAVLSVVGPQLMVLETGSFGSRRGEWDRADLRDVRSGRSTISVNGSVLLELQIVPHQGKPFGMLLAHEQPELDWIARVLRCALHLEGEPPLDGFREARSPL